ncbi:MAG: T9SS type A sorting domain-containing protein [Flavobacteriales bacterium]|nr:T9SS type A sorting domain-containing protein [Flavobacteriales bacterium]
MRMYRAFITSLLAATSAIVMQGQQPVFQWAEAVNNVAFMYYSGCTDAEVAADGAVYVTGQAKDAWAHGSLIIENEVARSPFLARYDASGDMIWVRPGGWALTTVGSNAIYVTGDFHGTRDFGGSTFTADSLDAFLMRYDANGNVIWARQMGGGGGDKGISVAVDALGQVQVAGIFQGSATFGTTTLIATHDSTGFLATYDASGNFIRAMIAGGTDNVAYNVGYNVDLACDASGHTYWFGMFDGTASFNGTNLTSSSDNAMALARFESNGTCTWATRMGGTANIPAGLGIAANGNAYVSGTFRASGTFGTISIPDSFTADDAFLALYDPNGDPIWAQRIVTSSSAERMYSITVNSAGNAVVSGISGGTSATVGASTITGISGQLTYVAEFDATGAFQWAERLCTARPFIALGAMDDLYLFGSELFTPGSNGTIFDFDTGIAIGGAVSGRTDAFLAHYDVAHDFQWLRVMGSTPPAYDQGAGIVSDANGNVYTVGRYTDSAILCGDTLKEFPAVSSGFLSKRDGSGACIWTREFGTSGNNVAHAITIDGNGDLIIAGAFSDTVTLGSVQLVSDGGRDLFVAKYDPNGVCLWAKRGGGTANEDATSVAVSANGDVSIAGSYFSATTIGTATFTSAGGFDMFIAHYDASGNLGWAKSMGGAGYDLLAGLALDATGNAYLSGSFTASATFDTETIIGTGSADMFLAKYDATGDPVWVQSMPGTGSNTGAALVINDTGNLYVTGHYYNTIDLGSVTLTGSPSNVRAFLACYTDAGVNLWAQDIQSTGGTEGYALAARPGGDIVLAGQLVGTAVFAGTTLTSTSGSGDVLLAAYNAAGQPLWATNMGGNGTWDQAAAAGVCADADHVHATGYFGGLIYNSDYNGGSITFVPGDPSTTRYAPNSLDVFVVKYAIDESVGLHHVLVSAPSLILSPNPVDHFFTLSGDDLESGATLAVRDMTGREVPLPFTIQTNKAMVDASSLSSGSYSIIVRTSRSMITQRFIKE